MKLELVVKLRFKATHTLEENEKIHEHEWRVDTTLEGDSKLGRVISLPRAQSIFRSVLSGIAGTHLNTNPLLDNHSREIPTCENLSLFLFEHFSNALRIQAPELTSLKITSIEVGVSEDDGYETGAARISC